LKNKINRNQKNKVWYKSINKIKQQGIKLKNKINQENDKKK
jgi:hypothetical protein